MNSCDPESHQEAAGQVSTYLRSYGRRRGCLVVFWVDLMVKVNLNASNSGKYEWQSDEIDLQ